MKHGALTTIRDTNRTRKSMPNRITAGIATLLMPN